MLSLNESEVKELNDKNNFSAPPHWLIEPKDIQTSEGQAVVINCKADGLPKPTMKWFKTSGNKSYIIRDINLLQLFSGT